MGRDKALLEWQGERLLDVAVGTLSVLCDRVFISSSNPLHAHPDATRIPDAYGAKGPLGGLASVLEEVDCGWLLLLPCDMPGMKPEALRALLAARDEVSEAVVFEHAGVLQGQIGLYRRDVLGRALEQLEGGDLSLKCFLRRLALRRVVADASQPWYAPTLFQNINSEGDWQRFKKS